MNSAYLQPIIQSTQNVFEQLLNLPVKLLPFSENHLLKKQYEFSGLIHFTNGIKGFLIASFPEKTALQLVGKLVGETNSQVDQSLVIDGIGEITNLICGNSKTGLGQFGWKIELSLPHVILGENYSIRRPKGVLSQTSFFQSDLGNFKIELSLKLEDSVLHSN